jgi:hypothetical protein
MAYARVIDLSLGTSNAGLSDLRAQFVDTAGADTGAAISSGFTGFGRGLYQWYYAAFADGFRGSVRFYSNAAPSVPLSAIEINPEDYENLDTKVSTRAASASALDAAAVWTYATRTLTQSAAQVAAIVEGDDLALKRGDTWTIALTGLGSLVGRSKLWFTVKRQDGHTDAEAVLQIEESGGLLRLNGAAATAGQGSLTVTSAAAGDLTISVAAVATDDLTVETGLTWDIQMLVGAAVTTLTEGTLEVTADRTRAVS